MADLTPDDLARLLLPATPALLEGWCGPVVTDCDGPAVMFGGVLHGLHMQHGSTMGGFFVQWREAEIACSIDLARAECRDRVARVVAVAAGLNPANGVRFRVWRDESPGSETHATLDCGMHGSERINRLTWWALSSWLGPQCHALADLDPHDPRRLPDGSRHVDALALRLVAEEVLRG